MIDLIGFDADDTLWHNEVLYTRAQEWFELLLSAYGLDGDVQQELFATEMRNLDLYGYGIKALTLSMIETAIRVTDGRVGGAEIEEILELSREMLHAPVELLDQVAEVVAGLSSTHRLMVITKGDLFDQERKLARSGLASYFTHVEIVSEKTGDVYRSLLAKHRVEPYQFLMVGNSLRSDILPVIELGGRAVHIPYHTTWAHETVVVPAGMPAGFVELQHIGLLPGVVERLNRDGDGL